LIISDAFSQDQNEIRLEGLTRGASGVWNKNGGMIFLDIHAKPGGVSRQELLGKGVGFIAEEEDADMCYTSDEDSDMRYTSDRD
jgi:hypothetical protein